MPSEAPNDQLLARIRERAATDLEFRNGMLTDPNRAIAKAFGVPIPDGLRIRAIERAADVDLLIVLPEFRGNRELTDDELDIVAGGDGDPPTW